MSDRTYRKTPIKGQSPNVVKLLDQYYDLEDQRAKLPEGQRRAVHLAKLRVRRKLTKLGYSWSKESNEEVARALEVAQAQRRARRQGVVQ
jgi:phosphoenolpyruvate carboxylase